MFYFHLVGFSTTTQSVIGWQSLKDVNVGLDLTGDLSQYLTGYCISAVTAPCQRDQWRIHMAGRTCAGADGSQSGPKALVHPDQSKRVLYYRLKMSDGAKSWLKMTVMLCKTKKYIHLVRLQYGIFAADTKTRLNLII